MFNAKQFEKILLKALKTITRGLKGPKELIKMVFQNILLKVRDGVRKIFTLEYIGIYLNIRILGIPWLRHGTDFCLLSVLRIVPP